MMNVVGIMEWQKLTATPVQPSKKVDVELMSTALGTPMLPHRARTHSRARAHARLRVRGLQCPPAGKRQHL